MLKTEIQKKWEELKKNFPEKEHQNYWVVAYCPDPEINNPASALKNNSAHWQIDFFENNFSGNGFKNILLNGNLGLPKTEEYFIFKQTKTGTIFDFDATIEALKDHLIVLHNPIEDKKGGKKETKKPE